MEKIGFVINGLAIGGNEKSVSLLSKALSNDFKVVIIVFDGSNVVFNYHGELIDIHEPAKSGTLNKVIVTLRRLRKIAHIIKLERIDILFTVTASVNAVSHCRFRGVKKIVSCRDYGDLERKTFLYTHMLKSSDLMIFNSKYMENYYVEAYPADRNKCCTLYNIVDTHHIQNMINEDTPADFIRFCDTHMVISTIGRFCKEKGFNHLVRAFCRVKETFPNAGLVIVGDGELHTEIYNMIDKCVFKEDIFLPGAQSNPYKYISRSKLFALSSISEGFPNVLLEGMACGLPVVATDCKSGPREILTETFDYHKNTLGYEMTDYGVICECFEYSDDYLSFETNDAEKAFADAIVLLLSNQKLYNKYAISSRKRCEHFSSEMARKSFIHVVQNKLYEKV